MNGAEALVRAARAAGVDVCFANPGTTELHLVGALDAVPEMRAVLGLFEGVCTGAADGYGRMTDRPALTLLHLGPGFANGIANLHNAKRARTPVVNLIGDHATWHVGVDPPLASDIESLARPVSAWYRKSSSADGVAADAAEAIAAATGTPGVATLAIPSDCAWGETSAVAAAVALPEFPLVSSDAIQRAAEVLEGDGPRMLLLGGRALRDEGLRWAARIQAKTGCRVFCETFPARLERGTGLPAVERLPYFPDQVLELLKSFEHLVIAGADEPVAFFGYPGIPSRPIPASCQVTELSLPTENIINALQAVAEEVGANADGPTAALSVPARPSGELNPVSLGTAILATQPDGLIVMDEAATSGLPFLLGSVGVPRFSYLTLTGGAIGQGLPCATGAAIACPDRRVLAFQADGSGLYTLQSLWTQAREGLNVTTVICANRLYRILRIELDRSDVSGAGEKAQALTDLGSPELDWVALAKGFGVPGERVATAEDLCAALERSYATPGPYLIEAVL